MNLSRRAFLGTGSKLGFAALITGQISAVAFGQQKTSPSLGSGVGNVVPKSISDDPLSKITRAMFTENLKTKFTFRLGGVKLTEMPLVAVLDENPPNYKSSGTGTRDCFSIVFRGPNDLPLRQGTYTLEHAKLGTFKLFIVPGQKGWQGTQYGAVINRLNP